MSDTSRPKPQFKVWLETDEGYVFGPGVYSLLRQVEETGTLKKAAEHLDMSYRYAWGMVKKAERKLGLPLFKTHKGGKSGGGGTEITAEGREYMEYFSKIIKGMEQFSGSLPVFHQDAQNRIKVKIVSIQKLEDNVKLVLEPENGFSITTQVDEEKISGLSPGDEIFIEYNIIVNKLERQSIKDP